ncbi:SGNH/GDSL hydrolase family protein [Hufsiella ginkgonis]|uniref:SGNH/GDSL hydrolase family protein n=1 Tax=Hufsiella ginkgonis TaxID=2695274 RepID=A0A7K1Y2U5_9SPHI|nr:SGNH/GDSL hydrolase family protein [Hufsiella ginkgonis]MXV17561.1 SGNH/GDSL hydrolase family protein [Hufsiella ginkgonis]
MTKLWLIFFLAAETLAGCSGKNKDMTTLINQSPVNTSDPAGGLSYLALGDSYTVGESVPSAQAFPAQLADGLKQQGKPVGNIQVIARTGWTTDELQAAIRSAKTGTFDVVTLLIGVNNQYRGYSQVTYREEFRDLLATAIRFANGSKAHVFVLSIPDWGVMPFAEGRDRAKIGAEIDAFNAINKEETLKAGVSYTDITLLSKQALTDLTLAAPDGLHPSGKQYSLWVKELVGKVVSSQ